MLVNTDIDKLDIKELSKLRQAIEERLERLLDIRWQAESETRTHHDKYCSHCGYLCDRCGRPN